MGGSFFASNYIKFNLHVTGTSPDNLVNRDWVGIRVFMNTVKFIYQRDILYYYCTSSTCSCCSTCSNTCCCRSPDYYYL
jgi:hypothetical protein